MAKIPNPIDPIVEAIDEAHQKRQDKPRYHMGASLLGHHCDRWLWLNFRWAVIEKFEGRILRLFRRGHHEEQWIVEDLKAAGIEITDYGASQSRVDFGCHVSGSIDGIIQSGVPQAPKTKHIAEFKTHSKKSFEGVEKNGVEKSKPMHYAQMQIYMMGKDLERALYVAICKDDDRIYTERVKLDKEAAQALVEKGHRLALSDRMPEPCPGASPSWYQCKFCPAYEFCHETKTAKEVNCRTCANITPKEDGTFYCEKNQAIVPNEAQHGAYPCHVLHPDLVPWELCDSQKDFVGCYVVDGQKVHNGDGGLDSRALLNPIVREAGKHFDVLGVKVNETP